jgi:hypothetical protein
MQLQWKFQAHDQGATETDELLWKLVLPSVCANRASAVVCARVHPLQPPSAVGESMSLSHAVGSVLERPVSAAWRHQPKADGWDGLSA